MRFANRRLTTRRLFVGAGVMGLVVCMSCLVAPAEITPISTPPGPVTANTGSAMLPGEFPELYERPGALDHLLPSVSRPVPDVLQEKLKTLSAEFAPRESHWLDEDRSSHVTMLAQRSVDTLVIPAQVQGFGTDRISRSLMDGRSHIRPCGAGSAGGRSLFHHAGFRGGSTNYTSDAQR